ncbi:helix-turn-helix domain-containing protein [Amycolatopsis sp. NBC_00345]|uniref:helix-turn-helix domain-containing protein n=1 Tax=Amycolatopsis sp. NBC_00345 TaxID=2975955 RepID=UPI002E259F0E
MVAVSLRRRRLAAAIHQIREDAGLTLVQAAKISGFSQPKLSRIEAMAIGISGDDTLTYCTNLGVPEEVTEALVQLARRAKSRDWWRPYSDVLGRSAGFFELEADAVSVRSFTLDVIPGLVQTPEYCHAMIRDGLNGEPEEAIRQRVEARMQRQAKLDDPKLTFWAIIDESALMRNYGGAAVMADQLEKLTRNAQQGNISIQVLPLDAGVHGAVGTPFDAYTLTDGLGVIARDDITGGYYIENEEEVQAYNRAWSELIAAALPFGDSIERLRRRSMEHRSRARGISGEMAEKHAKRQ